MRFRNPWRIRIASALAVVAIAGVAAVGMTASNTLNASEAGSGVGAISGYTVSGIKYTLDETDPSKYAAVTFDVEASDVSSTANYNINAKLDGTWSNACGTRVYAVGPPAKTTVTCTYSGTLPTVESSTSLTVVVAQK